jgi:tellurite resistance protein
MSTESSQRLRQTIEKAIEDLELTQAEFDEIIKVATEDGIIDKDEHALLDELLNLIESQQVKLVP